MEVDITASDFDLTGHLYAKDGRHKEVNDERHDGQVQLRKGLEGVARVHGNAHQREKGTEAHEPAHGGGLPPECLCADDFVQLKGP